MELSVSSPAPEKKAALWRAEKLHAGIVAMTVFLGISRNQYFFDGNKRTGRLMMNGILLSAGYDAISIPFKRQLEFNERMLHFYDTGEKEAMFIFLLSCSITPHEKPSLEIV
jgi:hypothetical protein